MKKVADFLDSVGAEHEGLWSLTVSQREHGIFRFELRNAEGRTAHNVTREFLDIACDPDDYIAEALRGAIPKKGGA